MSKHKFTALDAALNPRVYIAYWFIENNKTARQASKSPNLMGTIRLDYKQHFAKTKTLNMDRKITRVPEGDLEDAYNEYIDEQLKKDMKTALNDYACIKPNMDALRTWIKAITGTDSENDVMVIAHWLWLIKRNAFEKSVIYQIMPVLYGKQGAGKTKALDVLINPIKDFRLTIGMNQLSDERVFEGLSTNFVVLFDELQGVERADMNALKKQITATHNSYRKLYSHAVVNIPMRCSFIGATNKPISESLNDSTGMRRFWQIKTLDKIDWAAVNKISSKDLYLGIDENLEDGYLKGPLLDQVLETQKSYVNAEPTEEFLKEHGLLAESQEYTLISSQDLYDAYGLWTNRVGVRSKGPLSWFIKKIIAYGLESVERRTNKGHKKLFFKINKDSIIQPSPATTITLKETGYEFPKH
jgi:hypothetical protein